MGLSGVLQERLPLGCFMCQLFGELCFVAVVFYPFPPLFMNYCSLYDPALGCVCHGIIYLFVCLFASLASPPPYSALWNEQWVQCQSSCTKNIALATPERVEVFSEIFRIYFLDIFTQ